MKTWIHATVAILCVLAARPSGAGETARAVPVTVNVTALHGDGTPFPDLWLVLLADNPDADPGEWIAKTDAVGVAHFTVEPPAESRNLFVKVAGLGSSQLAPIEDRQSVRRQHTQVLPNYSFSAFLTIPLADGVTEYAATLTMYESVRVSAQLVDEAGQPLAGGIMVQINNVGMDADMHSEDESDPLSIGGIRKGGTAEIAIYGPSSPKPLVVRLEPHQTLENVDLGQVHVPPYGHGEAPVRITLTGRDRLLTRAVEWLDSSVTLIAADGQSSYFFAVVDNRVMGTRADNGIVRIDPGTYYVAPGMLIASRADLLRKLVLNGVDVDAAGVPKITAVAGQEVQMEVDIAAAEQAILTAAGQ